MATYKEIHGTNIEVVSSDPSNPVNGQLWYNTSTNKVKGFLINPGSWSTGGTLNSARGNVASAGIQTAGLIAGGQPPVATVVTELYNGANWTEVNDLNQGRQNFAGAGTNTAAVVFGGLAPSDQEVHLIQMLIKQKLGTDLVGRK